MSKYRITVNEDQLKIMNTAMEEYFRLRTGQFDMLSDALAMIDTDFSRENPNHDQIFKDFLDRRDYAGQVFKVAYRIATHTGDYCGIKEEPEDSRIAYELHQVFRHQLWEDRGCVPDWSVEGNRYLPVTDQPKAEIERVDTNGQEA